jgi:hypothetical protein
MLKQLIEYIGSVALKHVAVKQFKYQKRIMINQQNNNGYIQFIIETDPFFQLLRSVNLFTVTLNIDILAFPTSEYSVLDCQDDCFTVGNEVLHYIDSDDLFMGQLSVWDYSFLALENFTDDNAAGQRISLELVIPDPIDLCKYIDNFNEDDMGVDITDDVDLSHAYPESKSNDLILNPIKLKTKSDSK